MPNGEGTGHWDGITSSIVIERMRQMEQWGNDHDDRHTPLNWIGLIAHYSSKWVSFKFNLKLFRRCMIKTAAICIAAIDYAQRRLERES